MTGLRAGLAVIATLCALGSVVALGSAARETYRLWRRAAWRRVEGRVLMLRLEPRGASGLLVSLEHESEGVRSTASDLEGVERRLAERDHLRERLAVGSTQLVRVAPDGTRELVTGLAPRPMSGVVVALGLLAPAGLLAAAVWLLG